MRFFAKKLDYLILISLIGISCFIEKNQSEEDIQKINRLLQNGSYEEILENKKWKSEYPDLYEKAEEYNKILKSNDIVKLEYLASVCSPRSLRVVESLINIKLDSRKFENFKSYISKAKRLNMPGKKPSLYLSKFYFIKKNYIDGINELEKSGIIPLNGRMKRVAKRLKEIKEGNIPVDIKITELVKIYTTSMVYSNEIREFSKYINIEILEMIAKYGISSRKKGVSYYTERLINMEYSPENLYYHLKALLYDKNNPDYVRKVIEERKNDLSAYYYEDLKKTISSIKKEKEREEYERKKRYQERQRQRKRTVNGGYSPGKTNLAGKDFLNYYSKLGLKPGATDAEVRKGYRKTLRKVKGEGEDKLKEVNNAYNILSDSKKKSYYDKGIDPDSPHAQSGSDPYQRYEYEDLNDFFNVFMGGNGNYYERSYSFYM